MENQKFGRFLSQLRERQGLTQRELAEKIGVTDKAISKWEQAHGLPNISMIQSLAKFFGITIEELLNGNRTNEVKGLSAYEEAVIGGRKQMLRLLERKMSLIKKDLYGNTILDYVFKHTSIDGLMFLLNQNILKIDNNQIVWNNASKNRINQKAIYEILIKHGNLSLLEQLDYFNSSSYYESPELYHLLQKEYSHSKIVDRILNSQKASFLLHIAAERKNKHMFTKFFDSVIKNNNNYNEKNAYEYISNVVAQPGDTIVTQINNENVEAVVEIDKTYPVIKVIDNGMYRLFSIDTNPIGNGYHRSLNKPYTIKKQVSFFHKIFNETLPHILRFDDKALIKKVLSFQTFPMTVELAKIIDDLKIEWAAKHFDWTHLKKEELSSIAKLNNLDITLSVPLEKYSINDFIATNDISTINKMVSLYKDIIEKGDINEDMHFTKKAAKFFNLRKYTSQTKNFKVDTKLLIEQKNYDLIRIIVKVFLEDFEKDQLLNYYSQGDLKTIKALLEAGACFSTLRSTEYVNMDYENVADLRSPKLYYKKWEEKYTPKMIVGSLNDYNDWTVTDELYTQFLIDYQATRDMSKTNLTIQSLKDL